MSARRCLCLILSLAAAMACAEQSEDESSIKTWLTTDRDKLPPPAEQEFTLPDLAGLKDWYVYPMDRRMGSARVEIAADSVSIGKEDRILRYAVAIIPKSGLRNVFFEGIDCFTSRYRNYAWAQPDQTWRKADKLVWRVALGGTINAWQGTLINDFCGDAGPYSLKEIQKAVREGELPPKTGQSR